MVMQPTDQPEAHSDLLTRMSEIRVARDQALKMADHMARTANELLVLARKSGELEPEREETIRNEIQNTLLPEDVKAQLSSIPG